MAYSAIKMRSFDGKLYAAVHLADGTTWNSAHDQVVTETEADQFDWFLSSITSAPENDFVTGMLKDFVHTTAFIGLYEMWSSDAPHGEWFWMSGDSLGYQNWDQGQPNDIVSLANVGQIRLNGHWNDISLIKSVQNSWAILELENVRPVNLVGTAGNDRLVGGALADHLQGASGQDTLIGGQGKDTLEGGLGDDVLVGRAGRDTFAFAEGDGYDRIRDFALGRDHIAISNAHALSDITFDQIGSDVHLSFGTIDILVLNKSVADLHHDANFVF